MIAQPPFLLRLRGDISGSMAIETAFILPLLLLLSLGSFDLSRMIAKQSELQKALNEASDIVLASPYATNENKENIKSVIMTSVDLTEDQVTLTSVYRCGDQDFIEFSTSPPLCPTSQNRSTYIKLVLTDTSVPMWKQFGIGSTLNYRVARQMQIS